MAKAKDKNKTTKQAKPASKPASNDGAGGTGATQMSTVLDPPKPDPDRAQQPDPRAKERQDLDHDPNAEDEGPDKVYGIASRARWGANPPIAELNAEAAEGADKTGEQE